MIGRIAGVNMMIADLKYLAAFSNFFSSMLTTVRYANKTNIFYSRIDTPNLKRLYL
jgi:hypothetical protein